MARANDSGGGKKRKKNLGEPERREGAGRAHACSLQAHAVSFFPSLSGCSLFLSPPSLLFLTCSRQRERAREYILGGKSELEGAERKRAILAQRAGGDDDRDFGGFVDLSIGDKGEGTPLLALATATWARTLGRGEERRELRCGAPLELGWPAMGAVERERARERLCKSYTATTSSRARG